MAFVSAPLDALRQDLVAGHGGIREDGLLDVIRRRHEETVPLVTSADLFVHAPFLRPDTPADDVLAGWRQVRDAVRMAELDHEIETCRSGDDPERLLTLIRQREVLATTAEECLT
jgi:hypothetical protein